MPPQGFRHVPRADSLDVLSCYPPQQEEIIICASCGSKMLRSEQNWRDAFGSMNFCCGSGGSRRHIPWQKPTPEMIHLMKAKQFPVLSRALNSLFSPMIIFSKDSEGFQYQRGGGPPILRINGQMYGQMKKQPSACWFVHDITFANFYKELITGKYRPFVHSVCSILREKNRMAASLKNPDTDLYPHCSDIEEGSICICEHDDQVSLAFIGPNDAPPSRVSKIIGRGEYIDELDPLWELLGYPIFHIYGDIASCWSEKTRALCPRTPVQGRGARKPALHALPPKLSLNEYVRSVMFHEPYFWTCGRLTQQYLLDNWSRTLQKNMRFWSSKAFQEKLSRHISNFRGKDPLPGKIFMPSIPGSPLYLQRFYHDALHISAVEGNPHLFITMTANPQWEEVKKLCRDYEDPSFRHDVIARVFVAKRKKLFRLLNTKDFLFLGHLGIQWAIWVVEHQKSGLPHIHAAVRLRISPDVPSKLHAEQMALMDMVVSAQMPNVASDPLAFHLVNSYMIHKPCSPSTCMVKRKDGTQGCRFFYELKKPVALSHVDARGFPVYKRGPNDLRVVPHCVKLLKEMRCHLNTEWTLSSQCICYEYKYFTKGKSVSGIRISDAHNEIAAWKAANVVCAAEVTYRLLGFHMHFRDPSVILCRFHLPRVTLTEHDVEQMFYEENIPETLSDESKSPSLDNDDDIFGLIDEQTFARSALHQHDQLDDLNEDVTEHFDVNLCESEDLKDDPLLEPDDHSECEHEQPQLSQLQRYFLRPLELEEITYTDFFAKFKVASASQHNGILLSLDGATKWVMRPPCKRVLARMPWVSPFKGELYYLRVLLLAFPARSFDDLKGSFKTFAARCFHEGLVTSDVESLLAMRDAIREKHSGTSCRHLLAVLMFHVGNVHAIWEDLSIRAYIVNDFESSEARGECWSSEIAQNAFLMQMVVLGVGMGHSNFSLSSFGLPSPPDTEQEVLFVLSAVSTAHHCYDSLLSYASLLGISVDHGARVLDKRNEVRNHFARIPKSEPESMQSRIQSLKRPTTDEQFLLFENFRFLIDRCEGGCYHIDAPAGCGKTYLCRTLLEYVRYSDKIGIAVATTGIASLQFVDGRTGHSMFGFGLMEMTDIKSGRFDSKYLSSILDGKNSERIQFLREAVLIIWDEISMLHRLILEGLNTLLKAIMQNDAPFGGKLLITLGDWRQIPPVDELNQGASSQGSKVGFDQEVDAAPETYAQSSLAVSVKTSSLWSHFTLYRLVYNVRAENAPHFHQFLLSVGDGDVQKLTVDTFLANGINVIRTSEEAINFLYVQDMPSGFFPPDASRRALLAPYNDQVTAVNELCSNHVASIFKSDIKCFKSADTYVPDNQGVEHPIEIDHSRDHEVEQEKNLLEMDMRDADDLSEGGIPEINTDLNQFGIEGEELHDPLLDTMNVEILHSLNFPGVPPHELRLAAGMVVVVLRNIDSKRRILNGSRFVIESIHPRGRLISLVRPEDYGKPDAEKILLPRIVFDCRLGDRSGRVQRKQFPLRPAYGLTVHKSQSATMDRVVVDCRLPMRTHGQLYVALSRVRLPQNVLILMRDDQEYVANVVEKVFLEG